jgi:hypothetical protein
VKALGGIIGAWKTKKYESGERLRRPAFSILCD